ncbi:hypothetical protein ACFLUU_02485 [Chloroflexota bacterium]
MRRLKKLGLITGQVLNLVMGDNFSSSTLQVMKRYPSLRFRA